MAFSLEPIQDFEAACQRHYVCYVVAIRGTHQFSEGLARSNQGSSIHFSDQDPNARKTTATLRISELRELTRQGGEFEDRLAKSTLVALYSEWDEYYRPRIAKEHLVGTHSVRSDLMGDLRLIRHCIVHAKSVITDEHRRLKALDWLLKPGELTIAQPMMNRLFNQLREEHVVVDQELGAK